MMRYIRGSGDVFTFIVLNIEIPVTKSEDPDETPRSASSERKLHCSHIYKKKTKKKKRLTAF